MVEINLPTYIPLEEAATRYNIPLETLRRAVENSLVRAVAPHGNLSMAEVAEDDIIVMIQKPTRVLPTFIALSTAIRRYDIPLEILEQAIQNNTIRAVLIEDQLAIAEEDVAILTKQLTNQIIKTLPAFISLNEATKQYNVPVDALIEAINKNVVRAVRVGDIIKVAESDAMIVAAQVQKRREDDELVSFSEAARRLGLPVGTIFQWNEHGWLPVLGSGIRKAKLVSWNQAQALGRLRQERNGRGSRLIPKSQDFIEYSVR